jgi:hypothetical protein
MRRVPSCRNTPQMAAQTLPLGHPRHLASQPLGKLFGSVDLVREALASCADGGRSLTFVVNFAPIFGRFSHHSSLTIFWQQGTQIPFHCFREHCLAASFLIPLVRHGSIDPSTEELSSEHHDKHAPSRSQSGELCSSKHCTPSPRRGFQAGGCCHCCTFPHCHSAFSSSCA